MFIQFPYNPNNHPIEIDTDYFYFQPLTSANYSVMENDDVWQQKDTFEFSFNKKNWRKFSSLAHQETTTTYTLADYMTANPLNVVVAVDKTKYYQYVVSQGCDVAIYEEKTRTGKPNLGKVATLLTTDSTYAYYTCELNTVTQVVCELDPVSGVITCETVDTPVNLSLSVFFQDSTYKVRSSSVSISGSVPYMVTWAGTSTAPVVVQPTSYDVNVQVTTTVITETLPVNANDKLYLRNTSGTVNNGILSSIQSVNHNIGGILNTLTNFYDNTYTLTEYYASKLFYGDTHLISAGDLKLPATTLQPYCYQYMFYGCTSLTDAPELPATTLVDYCYRYMFQRCTSLTDVKCYATNIYVNNDYPVRDALLGWMSGTPSTGTFTQAVGAKFIVGGGQGIPEGWTICDSNGVLGFKYVNAMASGSLKIPEIGDTIIFVTTSSSKMRVITDVRQSSLNPSIVNGYKYVASYESFGVSDEIEERVLFDTVIQARYDSTYRSANPMTLGCIPYYSGGSLQANTYQLYYDHQYYLGVWADESAQLYFYSTYNQYRWTFSGSNYPTIYYPVYTKGYLYMKHTSSSSGDDGDLFNTTQPSSNNAPQYYIRESYYVHYEGLKFTSTGNSTVSLAQQGSAPTVDLKYSLDDGKTWTQWDYSEISLSDGQTVCLKGQNTTFATRSNAYNMFVMTGSIAASGNVMSIIDDGAGIATIIPANYCFMNLFRGCTALTTPPELPATILAPYCYYYMFRGCSGLTDAPVLPATTLQPYCYQCMFYGCRSLTTAPELPATTLTNRCYNSMFYGCRSLTTAPELPATTLANDCYNSMFVNCRSLTTAPELPATTLTTRCYNSMFQDCTNLNYIKCLATDISATNCTNNWVDGVSTTGTFVKAASMNDWTTGTSGIPSGWVVQDL